MFNRKNKNNKKSTRKPRSSKLTSLSNRNGQTIDSFIPSSISLKIAETQLLGTVTNASPLFTYLNWPGLGASYQRRSGNSIGIAYIDVNYSIAPSTNGFNNCRVVLLQQMGSIAAVNIASYFLATGTGVVPESVYNPGMNQENKILYDATHNLNTDGNNAIRTVRRRIKPAKGKIVFFGDTNSVWAGNLVLFVIVGPGSVGVDLNAQALMHFTD